MPQISSWLCITKTISMAITAPSALKTKQSAAELLQHDRTLRSTSKQRFCSNPCSYRQACRAVLISHGAMWAGSKLNTVAHHQHCQTEGPTGGRMSMEKEPAATARHCSLIKWLKVFWALCKQKEKCVHISVSVSCVEIRGPNTFSWNKVHNSCPTALRNGFCFKLVRTVCLLYSITITSYKNVLVNDLLSQL